MTVTLDLCRGKLESTDMGAGGYDAVEDVPFNDIDVHGSGYATCAVNSTCGAVYPRA
jgi:hypothetical protein